LLRPSDNVKVHRDQEKGCEVKSRKSKNKTDNRDIKESVPTFPCMKGRNKKKSKGKRNADQIKISNPG